MELIEFEFTVRYIIYNVQSQIHSNHMMPEYNTNCNNDDVIT